MSRRSRLFTRIPWAPALALLGLMTVMACESATGGGSGSVATLTVVAGDSQTVVVGHVAPAPVVVRALDDAGRPVAGIELELLPTDEVGTPIVSDTLWRPAPHPSRVRTDAAGEVTITVRMPQRCCTEPSRIQDPNRGPFHGQLLAVRVVGEPRARRGLTLTPVPTPAARIIALDTVVRPAVGQVAGLNFQVRDSLGNTIGSHTSTQVLLDTAVARRSGCACAHTTGSVGVRGVAAGTTVLRLRAGPVVHEVPVRVSP